MPRRLLSAAAACTLLLGLASCGEGGDGPVTTPPPEIDISAPSDGGGDTGASDGGGDEGDTNAAPDVPAPDPADYPGMDENTEDGAQQFTRYFFALLIWSFESGDPESIEDLYLASCEVCESNVETVREYEKQRVGWSSVEIQELKVEKLDSEDPEYDKMVHHEAVVSAHDEPSLEGGGVTQLPATHYKLQLGLIWEGDGWVVGGAALELDAAS